MRPLFLYARGSETPTGIVIVYTEFYEFRERPFQICTDPKYLWLGEDHKEALSALKYGVMSDNGFLLLTGDVGTGKTTLLNAWLRDLDDSVRVAHVTDPDLDLMGFFNHLGRSLEIKNRFSKKEDFLFVFKEFLFTAGARENSRILLVIDEAQKLSATLLEQVRLLSNIELPEKKLINIFLVGQNELNQTLMTPDCRALRQRITLNYNIKPLSEENTRLYITHRLKVAGSEKRIFTGSSLHEIFRLSGGYPRLINIICDRALLIGYAKNEDRITRQMVSECGSSILLPGENTTDFFPTFPVRAATVPPARAAKPTPVAGASGRRPKPAARVLSDRREEMLRRIGSIFRWGNLERWLSGSGADGKSRRIYALRVLIPAGILLLCLWLGSFIFSARQESKADIPNQISSRQKGSPPETSQAAAPAGEAAGIASRDPVSMAAGETADPGASENVQQDNLTAPGPGESGKIERQGQMTGSDMSKPDPAKTSELKQAKQYLADEKYGPAIELLSSLDAWGASGQPEIKEMYVQALVGQARIVQGRDRVAAEKLLQKAAAADPTTSEVYYELGKLSASGKDYPRSIEYYLKAEALKPDSAAILFNLGFSYAAVEAYPEAEKRFAGVVRLSPSYLDKALVNLAIVQLKQGKRLDGLKNLKQALSVNPDNRRAREYLDRFLSSAGESQ